MQHRRIMQVDEYGFTAMRDQYQNLLDTDMDDNYYAYVDAGIDRLELHLQYTA